MPKMTRRKVAAWLAPMRRAFAEIKTGEVDSIRGYAVTRLHQRDDYARLDYCIAGFRGLIDRLFPQIDFGALLVVERKLANGVPLHVADVDAALSFLRSIEKPLMGLSVAAIESAVRTEQIAIELEALRDAA